MVFSVEAQFEQCVDQLYGVLGNPSSFNRALGSIGGLFGATGVSFIRTSPQGELLSMNDHGHDPGMVSRFLERYAVMDPTRPILVGSQPGVWFEDDRVLSPEDTSEPEYVNDFAIDAGIRWFRGGKVEEGSFGAAFFSVHRPADAKVFDRGTLDMLERLKPHLARVARLLGEQADAGVLQAAPTALVDVLSTGLCVLNTRLQVVYANKSALSLLEGTGPLQVRLNTLSALGSAAQSQLRRAVSMATGFPRQARSFCPNPDDVLPRRLQIRVLPLDEQANLARAPGGPFALLFLARGTSPLKSDELCQLFDLTPSEAELVRLLSLGLSPAICADRRGVSISTVRTQLKSVYAKTGVCSLPQVMSLVLALPGIG